MYTQHKYQPTTIWNFDKSGVQANRNDHTRVFASRGTRNVQCIVPNEKEHLTILSAISVSGMSIPNYYRSSRAKGLARHTFNYVKMEPPLV